MTATNRRLITAAVVITMLLGEAAAIALLLHDHILAGLFLVVAAPTLAEVAIRRGWVGAR